MDAILGRGRGGRVVGFHFRVVVGVGRVGIVGVRRWGGDGFVDHVDLARSFRGEARSFGFGFYGGIGGVGRRFLRGGRWRW